MDNLEGRVALVTGASRGIGRAVAIALAAAGADLVVNYRNRSADANAVVAEIEGLKRKAIAVQADVGVTAEIGRLVLTAQEQLGPIGILVNNAGIARPRAIAEVTEQDWDEVLRVNLKAAFLLTQTVLPGMRARRWGRIVNISSSAAQTGGVSGPHYAASKAGMHGLTHCYAAGLAREGITVNTIAPALVETDMVTANPQARVDLIPIGRFGRVEEVASVAVMLVRNGYLTGQTINVNGGWFMS